MRLYASTGSQVKRRRVSVRLPNWLNPLAGLRRGLRSLRNRLRQRTPIDYIRIDLPAAVSALPARRSWIAQRLQGPAPLSLWELRALFDQIAADPRPRGVVLHLDGAALSLADLQTLRGLIARLRASGKRAIVHAQMLDTASYFIASAADAILLQPGGELLTTGLRTSAVFLKDALDRVGAALDVVAISPFKGAFDAFSRSDLSPEGEAQLNWLLDSRYRQIVSGIASGRGLSEDAVRALIDGAPYTDQAALEAGYIDGVVYEDDLPGYLQAEHLLDWHEARRRLRLPARPAASDGRYVAVLPISGLMIPGDSGSPPIDLPFDLPFIGGDRAGDRTIVRQARALLRDERAAAVIVFIESGGGAVIAAEAMTRALEALAAQRPVVIAMNGAAASGGYLVATVGRRIFAQPGTITGSIGVVTAKPVLGDLKTRLGVNSVERLRGANAAIFSEDAPFTPAQRAQIRASVEHHYHQFVARVARSRSMTPEAVDAVGGGRVWTGEQALKHGLIDTLGDLWAAAEEARRLAGLPETAPLHIVRDRGRWLPPVPARADDPAARLAAGIDYIVANARRLTGACYLLPLHLRDRGLGG
jgi:protease-4